MKKITLTRRRSRERCGAEPGAVAKESEKK
jgi:hypothetical protein